MPRPLALPLLALLVLSSACTVIYHRVDDPSDLPEATVHPGISVLLADSASLIAGKRLAILANQASVDEKGRRDVDLLRTDRRARNVKANLVMIFSPEHGINGTEDRTGIASGVDRASRLPVISLYGSETMPPPDSAINAVDMVLIDLQDVGSRTWTYEGAMVYTMRAAARLKKPVIILDRPNPITGSIVEGPILDTTLAHPGDLAAGQPGIAWALYPIPLRHGMTLGELGRFYNDELKIGADLHVIPARNWSREVWFDRTGLPFIAPSPNLHSFESEILYTGLVAFEATNLSVGRGTPESFRLIGAPWMNAARVISLLRDRQVNGVRFFPEDFTPRGPGDGKFNGQLVHGIRIEVTERNSLSTSRLSADLLSAIHAAHPTQLTIDETRFDRLFGSSAVRVAILRGDNPDVVIDRTYGPAYAFRQRVRKYLLY
ncbi:MAG: exo-beta-N-acetylmuramidase NamZ family protein [Gemmatimonadaceae bacterium]